MNLNEYAKRDATELAELVRKKEVTAEELADCAIQAAEKVNPSINAIVKQFDTPVPGKADGPFSGVPFVVKDLVLHLKDVPHYMGTRMLKEGLLVPPVNSVLFDRFNTAGLQTIGVTSTPEFGFNATTEPVLYGPTKNPYHTAHSSGGSSGGSSAAVAAGIVPIGHANDGGGSIRIPSAACGLVGLKPTRGRTPLGPDYAFPLMGLGIEFAVTRTVRDAATLLDCVEGPEVGAMFDIARPAEKYSEVIKKPTRKLKIAVTEQLPGTAPVERQISDAVKATAEILESLGHTIEIAAPEYDAAMFHQANYVAWASFLAAGVFGLQDLLNIEPGSDNVELATMACAKAGAEMRALDVENAFMVFNIVNRSFGEFMTQYDALLLPISAGAPLKLGQLNQNEATSARGWYDAIFNYFPFTAQFNVTGQPAIALPAGLHQGLPVSIQIAGPMGDEATLLQLARDLEEARPWRDIRPDIFVGEQ